MWWDEIQVWELLAGLGLFLFGMFMLEEALRLLVGRSFKLFIRKQTTNRVKAVFTGAFITAILQSSSMVVLLVMSFAGAGIIGLNNGIGIVLGANLGTTATGWLVSLFGFKMDIKQLIFPFLAVGGLGLIFLKSEKAVNFSKFLMGFSFMFLGLSYMKEGFTLFVEHVDISWLIGKPMILFFIVGFVLTGLIQSSSASIMIFLTSLSAGLISFEQALYLVIGADLGTTITALIGTIKGSSIKRKVGWSQFYFNVINAVLALVLMDFYIMIIKSVFLLTNPLFSVVAFHSLMNFISILVILPFLGIFTKLINKYIASDQQGLSMFLNSVSPSESDSSTIALEKEAIEFVKMAVLTNQSFFDLPVSTQVPGPTTMYQNLQTYEAEIVDFYHILLRQKLGVDEVRKINNVIVAIRFATHSAKDIKDIRHNFTDLSNATSDELYGFYIKIKNEQSEFYNEILKIIDEIDHIKPTELRLLTERQQIVIDRESDDIYALYELTSNHEVSISSLLNLVREVNNSNKELIRAIANFVDESE